MKILPVGDYVLIEPNTRDGKQTESGIYLPDEVKSDVPQDGIVVEEGTSGFMKGDFVIFKMWAGEEIENKGKKLKLVHLKDIIGLGIAEKDE